MANPNAGTYDVIALLGPDGAGKSTLLQDLVTALADPSAAPRAIQVAGHSANVLDIQGQQRVCQVADFADAETEAALLGSTRFAGAILVVSSADSLMPGHRASLERARQLGVPLLAVALTHCDQVADEELQDLVEMEIRELASKYGYPGDTLPIVHTRGAGRAERPREGREPTPRQSGSVDGLLSVLLGRG